MGKTRKATVTVKGADIEELAPLILTIRGWAVILDADLAQLYGVPTKRLNEQARRNAARFPEDFMFQLTPDEFETVKSQLALSRHASMRSHFATASKRNVRFLPYAFTEHGAIMAANVLNCATAVEMSVFIVRAFVKMREQLLTTVTLEKRLSEVEKQLLTHDAALRNLFRSIRPLLLPAPGPEKKPIGFEVREELAAYGAGKKEISRA